MKISELKIFKIANVTEAALVTFLLAIGLLDRNNWANADAFVSIFAVTLCVIGAGNCINNLYFISLKEKKYFPGKAGRVLYWISYTFFIAFLAIFSILLYNDLQELFFNKQHIYITSRTIIVTFITTFIVLIALYIVIRQPYVFYFLRKNHRTDNDRRIDNIGVL